MSPPPNTLTPRRFLLLKRGTPSSQTPSATPQFQSTPRFGPSSARWRNERAVEDVEDVEDFVEESEVEAESEEEGAVGRLGRGLPNDSIETESDEGAVLSESHDDLLEGDDSDAKEALEEVSVQPPATWDGSPVQEREPKRRRISISPVHEPSPPHEADPEATSEAEPQDRTPPGFSPGSPHDSEVSDDDDRKTTTAQQPTFRPAPRFKPTGTDSFPEGLLPAAFSPQRRGARYTPNGLAATLQSRLSDVQGWERGAPALELSVEEVRPGRRMQLVRGRVGEEVRRFMLAGEGVLTGLGRRAVVGVGCVVEVGQPVWDVVLEGEVWTVACDWSVV